MTMNVSIFTHMCAWIIILAAVLFLEFSFFRQLRRHFHIQIYMTIFFNKIRSIMLKISYSLTESIHRIIFLWNYNNSYNIIISFYNWKICFIGISILPPPGLRFWFLMMIAIYGIEDKLTTTSWLETWRRC